MGERKIHAVIPRIDHMLHTPNGIPLCWWFYIGEIKCLDCFIKVCPRRNVIDVIGRRLEGINFNDAPKIMAPKTLNGGHHEPQPNSLLRVGYHQQYQSPPLTKPQ